MRKISWHPSLRLGVEQVDDQHKRLIQLVNSLVSVVRAGVAEDLLAEICRELFDYTEFHFRDEETLMRDEGFPGLDAHARLHEEIKVTVKIYLEDLENGRKVTPHEVLDFLAQWLIKHVLKEDMKIAAFMREKRSAAQKEAADAANTTETQKEVDQWLSKQ